MSERDGPFPWLRLVAMARGTFGITLLAPVDVGLSRAAPQTGSPAMPMAFRWITQPMALPATGLPPLGRFHRSA